MPLLERRYMSKNLREFVDKDHRVMSDFYDICERYNERNKALVKKELKELIEEDPDFLDPYLFLYQILEDEGDLNRAEKILNEAYRRAIALITDKDGSWPDVLEWGWLENRHIIRTILNKALSLWRNNEIEESLDLFRKLLKTNPNDNIGARFYILAIRMGMSLDDFEDRFNKGGYYDSEMIDWFDRNYKDFLDEFGWWEKAIEEEEYIL